MGPVLDLARVAPLRALRRDFGTDDGEQSLGSIWAIVAVGISLLLASVWQAGNWQVGVSFALGLAATVGGAGAVCDGLDPVATKSPAPTFRVLGATGRGESL